MGCFDWPARRWFRILWVLVAIGLLASLPVLIIQASKHGWSVQDQMWFVAGLFTLLALPVSIYEVAMHLEYFTRPKLQIRVIRILWMVPIYAIDCFLSLTPQFHGQHDYFDAIRECYEAFVIYNFFMFLLAYLEDEYGDIDAYFSSKQDVPHLWPVNYICRQWHMGIDFFWQCKKGILNYVILQPLITFIRFVIYLCDNKTHHDDSRAAYPYLVTINMISASWALYCLVLMFKGTHNELKPIRPLSKFLIVKAVIFATFWQSVALALVTYLSPKVLGFDVLERLLPAVKPKEVEYLLATMLCPTLTKQLPRVQWGDGDRAAWLQSWLICVEMFLAALAHAYAFPPRDYIDPACQHVGNFAHNVKVMFDVRDVADDVEGVVYDTVQGRIEDIHQVGRAARNIVTRPSRLLGMLQRQSSKHMPLTDSEDPGSDTDDGSRRRQLLPVVGSASDSTSNISQQRLANRREYEAPTEQGRQTS